MRAVANRHGQTFRRTLGRLAVLRYAVVIELPNAVVDNRRLIRVESSEQVDMLCGAGVRHAIGHAIAPAVSRPKAIAPRPRGRCATIGTFATRPVSGLPQPDNLPRQTTP